MPDYKYKATDDQGKLVKGVVTAVDERELQLRLKEEGKYLVSAEEKEPKTVRALKAPVLAEFARQLGSLLRAGITLVRALGIMAEEDGLSSKLKDIYTRLLRSVRQGTALSDAMQEQNGTFPDLMIFMIRSAEASGNMDTTALRLADHYDKDHRLTTKVQGAFVYPRILVVMIVGVIVIIMTYVMPQFTELFSQMPTMPVFTQLLFNVSDFTKNYWWLLIILAAILYITGGILLRIPKVRLLWDQLIIVIPGVGKLMKIIYTARFARTLSSLYACGISIVNCLQIARNVVGNTYIESQFAQLIPFVRGGNLLSDGLGKMDGFAKKLASSVRVGEESGNLEELLVNMADSFDYESEQALNKLVSYVEPVMLIFMGIIVCIVMFGVIMPIYSSISYIGS